VSTRSEVYESLGKLIRLARERAGLSQQELAREIGLTRTSVTNIEQGRQHLQLDALYLIADCLRVTPSALLPRLPNTKRLEALSGDLASELSPTEQAWVNTILTTPGEELNVASGETQINSVARSQSTRSSGRNLPTNSR